MTLQKKVSRKESIDRKPKCVVCESTEKRKPATRLRRNNAGKKNKCVCACVRSAVAAAAAAATGRRELLVVVGPIRPADVAGDGPIGRRDPSTSRTPSVETRTGPVRRTRRRQPTRATVSGARAAGPQQTIAFVLASRIHPRTPCRRSSCGVFHSSWFRFVRTRTHRESVSIHDFVSLPLLFSKQ